MLPGVVEEQRHHRVAEVGVALALERQGRHRVRHHPRQPAGVERALLEVEVPRPVLLRLQPPLQPVGQPRHRALQRLELLVEIGAQPLELGRVGEVLGADLLVEARQEDLVARIGLGVRRRRPVLRRLALLDVELLGHLRVVGRLEHRLLLLRVDALVRRRVLGCRLLVALVLGVPARLLRLGARLVLLLVLRRVLGVGVLAELVAVAEVLDHPAREAGERPLVVEHRVEVGEGAAGVAVEMPPPERHHVLRPRRQRAARWRDGARDSPPLARAAPAPDR